jgi:hypothetical protein
MAVVSNEPACDVSRQLFTEPLHADRGRRKQPAAPGEFLARDTAACCSLDRTSFIVPAAAKATARKI